MSVQPTALDSSLTAAHIAYCVPLLKVADFLTAGVNVSRSIITDGVVTDNIGQDFACW